MNSLCLLSAALLLLAGVSCQRARIQRPSLHGGVDGESVHSISARRSEAEFKKKVLKNKNLIVLGIVSWLRSV